MKFKVFYRKMVWEPLEVEADSKEEAIDKAEDQLKEWLDDLPHDESINADWETDRGNVEDLDGNTV